MNRISPPEHNMSVVSMDRTFMREHLLPPVDVVYLYSILRGKARLIVIVMVLSVLAMLLFLQFVPPQYTALT